MRIKKGQASIEFFFMVSTVVFLFILISLVVVERNKDTKQTKDLLGKKDVCIKIANSITSVYSEGEGTTLKMSRINYGINISPSKRTIEVYDLLNRDDSVYCAVPVEKIVYYHPEAGYNGSVEQYQSTLSGYGSTDYSFKIENSTLNMDNIGDRVFVCTGCKLNEVSYAEGMTIQGDSNPLTNIVKRLDGDTFTLVASGEGTLPGESLFNVAYIKLGSPYCLLPILEQIGYNGEKACVEYSDPNCKAPKGSCNIFKSTSVVDKCLFNPTETNFTNWYTLFLYEDVQNLNSVQMGVLQNRISRAGWALLSGGLLYHVDQGDLMGAYVYDEYGSGVAHHVGDDSEGYFELTEPTVDFGSNKGSVKNPYNLVDFEPLYEFNSYPGYYAIARWKYPDQADFHGDIYYFTDYCAIQSSIKVLISSLLTIEYYNWAVVEFNLEPRIGNSIPQENPINIYVSHEITDLNYQGKEAWISRIEWCNLETGCTSWSGIDVGKDSGICQNHVSEYNNKKIAKCTITLNDPNLKNIGLKIKFSATSGSGRVPIELDFIQVETCY